MLRKKIFILLVIAIALAFTSALATATPMIVRGIYIKGIEPPEGQAGTKVLVFGGGATPNGTVEALLSGEEIIIINQTQVVIGNRTLGWTIADAEGYWEIIFAVPDVAPGKYTVFAVDNETKTIDAIGFIVLPAYIGIKIEYVSPQSGPVGTSVYISGSRATPKGEVGIYFDETNVARTTAEDWGWWSVFFKVPYVESGDYTVTALDVTTNTTDTAVFTVTPPPTIHVSPSEAPIGSKITISGEGFPARTGLYLTFEDLLLFSPTTTDEKGEFNITLFVPMVNSGHYTIKVTTTYPYSKAIANASFTVTLGIDTLLSGVPRGRLRESAQTRIDIEYSSLEADYNSFNSIYDNLRSTLDAARNLNYVFIITTIIFIATTAYFVIRKPKMKPT